MKKAMFPLIACLLLVACREESKSPTVERSASSPAAATQTQRGKDGFKGPVRSVLRKEPVDTTFLGIRVWTRYRLLEKLWYGAAGNLIEKIDYGSSGSFDPESFQEKSISTYDARGNLVKEAVYKRDGSLDSWYDYTYDAKGNQIEESYYWRGGSLAHKLFSSYDDAGRIIQRVTIGADGAVMTTRVYRYDNGNLVEETDIADDPKFRRRGEHVYSPEGSLVERRWYRADGTLANRTIQDDQGKVTEFFRYDEDGSLASRMAAIHDKRQNRVEQAWYNADGALSNRSVYTYEDGGNLTNHAWYDGDGSLGGKRLYTYRFDSYGNWLKKTTKAISPKVRDKSGKPSEHTWVRYQDITYYRRKARR